MKDEEITDLLRTLEGKLARADSLNLKLTEEVKFQRSASVLKDLNSNRVVELVVGVIVGIFLGSFIFDNWDSQRLAASAGILLFFTLVSILGCIRQLILINRFDCSQSVSDNQATLVSMRTYHLQFLRLAVLQFPFYLAYILIGFKVLFGINVWETGDRNWLYSNLIIGLILAPVSIWLYRSIRIENLHMKWVRRIYELSGGDQITEAIDFLESVETS